MSTWRSIASGRANGWHAGTARCLLTMLAALYLPVLILRDLLYRWGVLVQYRLPVPVVSVGNITCGGTGKTPAVVWLARRIEQMGYTPVILSRGYGQDEALLLARLLPNVAHFKNADRVAAGRQALATVRSKPVLLLDDGLQHRRLARDCNLVLIDALCPLGYGYCLPRGLLREPLSALRRADVILITRSDQVASSQLHRLQQQLEYLSGARPIFLARHQPICLRNLRTQIAKTPECLAGQPVVCFAGIGNPASFAQLLSSLGAHVCARFDFPDHHCYRMCQIIPLAEQAAASGAWLVTTAKDAVKLKPHFKLPVDVWVLEVELQIVAREERLLAILARILETSQNKGAWHGCTTRNF